jgi:Lrp/AsnC family transcriptional regulator, leucine-responsive regulatory protein
LAKFNRSAKVDLDEVDCTIIASLDANARLSLADLARIAGMSPQSTGDRIRRLEDIGVIAGFTVRLDPTSLGLPIGAYIRIRPAIGQLDRVAQLLPTIPEIVECDRITGEDCYIARVYVPTVQDLERIIDRIIPYAQTNTSVIQSSPIARRQPKFR